MEDVHDYVSISVGGRIEESINDNSSNLQCEEIRPKHSKFHGRGKGRCAFEKDGKIVKIAHSEEGVAQNKGAKKVYENVEKHSDKFAMPLAVDKENKVVIQEKADYWNHRKYSEDKQEELLREAQDKIDRAMEDGIACRDKTPENIGEIKGKGKVLTDLGLCETTGYD